MTLGLAPISAAVSAASGVSSRIVRSVNLYFMITSLLWTVSKIADADVIGAADLLALIVEEGTAEHGLPLLEGDVEHRNRIVLGPKVSVPCVLHELLAKARGYPKTWAVQTSRNRLMWREAFAATEECRAPNFEQFREAERE